MISHYAFPSSHDFFPFTPSRSATPKVHFLEMPPEDGRENLVEETPSPGNKKSVSCRPGHEFRFFVGNGDEIL